MMTANQAAEQIIADLRELRIGVRRIPALFAYIKQRALEGDSASADLIDEVKRTFDAFYVELEQITSGKVSTS